ncbi:MAG: nucleotidyltransferase family protein [Sterolibacterium sp.]|jgi:MurNAc alpha-1-phosphate uridylyltransferase|nr:nucleotidyltransferase family protein [Sterolibacterium sp.]
MKAMILAAGRGERMRPLSDTTPKPLLAVAGKPLIVWQIERLAAAGIRELVINHAHLGAQIEAALGDGARWGVQIDYSPETEALETAGGIRQALPLLGDAPFLVVSADIYCDCDYRALLDALANGALADDALACLWMIANPPWHAQGDFALRGGRLHLEGEPRLTYANFGLFRPEMFAAVTPGAKLALRPLLDLAIPAGRIQGACLQALWENLGTPAQLAALDARLHHPLPT